MSRTKLNVRSSPYLEGTKVGAIVDGVAVVSPAMLSLMDGASEDELRHLFANIQFINCDQHDWEVPLPQIDWQAKQQTLESQSKFSCFRNLGGGSV